MSVGDTGFRTVLMSLIGSNETGRNWKGVFEVFADTGHEEKVRMGRRTGRDPDGVHKDVSFVTESEDPLTHYLKRRVTVTDEVQEWDSGDV